MARSVMSSAASDAGSHLDSHDLSRSVSKRARFKSMAAQIKSSPARLRARFDPTHKYDEEMDADEASVDGITDSKAFNVGLVFKTDHPTDDIALKSKTFMQKAAHAVVHPQQAMKQHAAAQVPDDPPFLSTDANAEFLEAHDELDRLNGLPDEGVELNMTQEEHEQVVEEQEELVDRLESEREEMKTAWITSKHVRRVRVVPRDHIPWPVLGDCQEIGKDGRLLTRWDEYGLKLVEYYCQNAIAPWVEPQDDMSFQTEVLLHIAERLFIITAPWQTWIMKVREIYLWRDPYATGKCLLVYLFLIKTGYMMTSMYCYILYIVLKQKYANEDVARLRESHERVMDRGSKALKLGELFNQKEGSDLMEPLMNQFGPLIQQQSSDLADAFEVLRNFFHWQDERATWVSLWLIMSAALLSAFTSVEYSMKVFWLCGGFYFFGMRPIASLHPRYRRVVGVIKIGFWDVPNTAETAFKELREKAQDVRERMIEEELEKMHGTTYVKPMEYQDSAFSTNTINHARPLSTVNGTITERHDRALLDDNASLIGIDNHPELDGNFTRDILSFRGRYAGTIGRLIVTTTGIKFVRSVDQVQLWMHPFSDMLEMRKATSTGRVGKMAPTAMPNEGMSLIWKDDSKTIVEGMRKRDEAFNTILGFSGLQFMQLHPCDEGVQANGDETIEGRRGWRPWRTQEGDK